MIMLVISREQEFFAVESAIDRLVTEPELTIKPFNAGITPPSYIYGCTIIENSLCLVIDAATLLRRQIA